MIHIIWTILCLLKPTLGVLNYDINKDGGPKMYYRIANLTRTYYQDSWNYIVSLNEIKFTYERTVEYEFGFTIADIIDSYQRLITEIKEAKQMFKSELVSDAIPRLATVVKYYMKIWHQVNMLHQTPKKYMGLGDGLTAAEMAALFRNITFPKNPIQANVMKNRLINEYKARAIERERIRFAKYKKRQNDYYKRIRKEFIRGRGPYDVRKTTRKRERRWPIVYGWSIEGDFIYADDDYVNLYDGK